MRRHLLCDLHVYTLISSHPYLSHSIFPGGGYHRCLTNQGTEAQEHEVPKVTYQKAMGQDSVVDMDAGPIRIPAKVIKSPAIDVKQMGLQTPRRPVSKTVSWTRDLLSLGLFPH